MVFDAWGVEKITFRRKIKVKTKGETIKVIFCVSAIRPHQTWTNSWNCVEKESLGKLGGGCGGCSGNYQENDDNK